MRLLTIILSLALVLAAVVPAFADARDLRAFAPWMTLDDDTSSKLTAEQAAPIVHPRVFAAAHKTPDVPVITPKDTLALINQIYDGAPLPQPSALEDAYAKRIVDELKQFGYDQFGTPAKETKAADTKNKDAPPLPPGAVQDDFLLNNGDQLRITFRGQRQDSKVYAVNSEGQLIIDDLPPLSAAGRTIGQLRRDIQAQSEALHNTQVFVSLDSVRQISVLVVGNVAHPGRQTITVFNTVIDALMAAGGIEKTGSLRQVRVVRDGRSTLVDLYGLLVHGSALTDISLRDGDRIIVPPVGPTVGIAGNVKRPGIYEILPVVRGEPENPLDAAEQLSLQDMLDLAGGLLTPGKTRYIKLGLTNDGRETVTEIKSAAAQVFTDGSILKVESAAEARTGTVELAGETRRPGIYELERTPTLAALIDSNKVFGKNIYPLIGVIERRDDNQMAPQLVAFPPLLVLKGKFDRRLQDGDIVHLFSRAQMLALQKKPQTKKRTRQQEREDETGPLDQEYGSAAHAPDEDVQGNKIARDDDGGDDVTTNPVLSSFLKERAAFVRGAVRQEGAWPVADGISLENLIAASGGLTLEASTGDIEVTSRLQGQGHQAEGKSGIRRIDVNYTDTDPAGIPIGPGDSVRVKQKFQRVAENSVLIIGDVANPGHYDLSPGDHLSDLLREAGGLTPQAYPQGAIFSRESERRAEEMRFRAQAQQLEVGLAAALNSKRGKDEDAIDENKIGAAQELIGELKNAEAVGRITVEADPGALAAKPDEDILLESGDRIYVPKRPLTVRVAGEVLSPAALQFRKDKDARDYITQAGGFTYNADKDRAFVVYPDGSAQPLQVTAWNHTAIFVPPGSTIIVPRDPKPFDFIQTARDVSQILSNLAITGIFVDDIHNNNN